MAEPNTSTDIPELAALRAQPKAFSVPAPKELTGLSTEMGRGVPGVPVDYQKAAKELKTPAQVSQTEAGVLQRQSQLDRDIEIARQAKEQYQAESEASIATQRREAQQKIQQDLEAVRTAFPRPQMHPTKDNIQSLSTLFGLIGVIGMAVGGSGKMSATGALNAMGGMMKGWQQGRADLWKKEMQEFDKEMARIKAILEDAYKDAEKAEKALVTNTDEARALAQQAQAKLGGQVSKQILERQGIIPWKEYLGNVLKKDLVKAQELAFKEKEFGATQEYRKSQLDLEKEKIQKAEERDEAKERAKLIESVLERQRGTTGQTPAQFNQMIMQPGGQTAIVVSNVIGRQVGPKDATDFDGKTQYIHGLKTLADVAKDAKVSGVLQNVFASLNKFTFSDPDGTQSVNQNTFQQSVEDNLKDAGISDTAIVQQKLALDAVFQGIRAKTNRNNAPLREFQVLSDVLKPGSVGKDAYQTILANEGRVTREALPWVTDKDFNKYYEFKYKKPSPFGESSKSSEPKQSGTFDAEKEARYQKWLKEHPK